MHSALSKPAPAARYTGSGPSILNRRITGTLPIGAQEFKAISAVFQALLVRYVTKLISGLAWQFAFDEREPPLPEARSCFDQPRSPVPSEFPTPRQIGHRHSSADGPGRLA